jgi:CheY-like chemotaxis protein
MGLGLCQVHSIARLQGGQLVMESAEDQGTTVQLYIPLDYAPQLSQSQTSHPAPKPLAGKPPAKGSKILVVDDDPMVLEVVKAALQKAQFEVLVALDGKAGLDLFRRRSAEVGLIISDIAMPRMNGWDFAREVRAIDSAQRLIFMSGEPEATLISDMAQWGDTPPVLIRKPCTLHELLFAVEQQMGRR